MAGESRKPAREGAQAEPSELCLFMTDATKGYPCSSFYANNSSILSKQSQKKNTCPYHCHLVIHLRVFGTMYAAGNNQFEFSTCAVHTEVFGLFCPFLGGDSNL